MLTDEFKMNLSNEECSINYSFLSSSVTGGELFEDIVAREYYSEADARYSKFILPKTGQKRVFILTSGDKPFLLFCYKEHHPRPKIV